MNKKQKEKLEEAIIGGAILIFFTGLLFGIIYWHFGNSDSDCLQDKALSYCVVEGFESVSSTYSDIYFYCSSPPEDERKGLYNQTEKFYFTEEEQKECLIKEKNTFKKFANEGGEE